MSYKGKAADKLQQHQSTKYDSLYSFYGEKQEGNICQEVITLTNKQEDIPMKTLDIANLIKDNTPEGMEWDKDNSTDSQIVFKDIVKSTRWEDLKSVEGYYTSTYASIETLGTTFPDTDNDNTYRTKPQALASIAQAKLTQIMADVNGDSELYYTLFRNYYGDYKVVRCGEWKYTPFLSFKDQETAQRVLNDNADLLEQYKPLAG